MSNKRMKNTDVDISNVQEDQPVPTPGSEEISISEPIPAEVKSSEGKEETHTPVIYIGPSLVGGKLDQHSIFRNGIPDYLEKDMENCPVIKELIIPVNELAEARKNLMISGTRENALNKMVLHYLGRVQS